MNALACTLDGTYSWTLRSTSIIINIFICILYDFGGNQFLYKVGWRIKIKNIHRGSHHNHQNSLLQQLIHTKWTQASCLAFHIVWIERKIWILRSILCAAPLEKNWDGTQVSSFPFQLGLHADMFLIFQMWSQIRNFLSISQFWIWNAGFKKCCTWK